MAESRVFWLAPVGVTVIDKACKDWVECSQVNSVRLALCVVEYFIEH
jgi:hypothetical protein